MVDIGKPEPRRRFNAGERVTLFLIADGSCAECGAELEPGWHADHILPFSRAGQTELNNGQALCPTCNLKKGNRVMKPPREWQIRFNTDYWMKKKKDYLLHAAPGSGKTRSAADIARDWLDLQGSAKALAIIVCPNRSIKRSTVKTFNDRHVPVSGTFKNGHATLRHDIDGVVVTYQQVASRPDLFAQWCRQRPVLVILDEVHHVADQEDWGAAIEEAFTGAAARLMLTGTPFRSDDKQIKWVPYVEDGKTRECKPDFSYGFGEAVFDKTVLELIFHLLDGEGHWIEDDQQRNAWFWDAAKYARRRAKTAAIRRGDWRPTAYAAAHDQLMQIRQTIPQAAAIIMVDNIEDAKAQQRDLERIAGRGQVDVVTSEDDDAMAKIDRFTGTPEKDYRDGRGMYMVFVGMISEGTDIPRVMVGVHASTVEAPVKCMQFWTRAVRLMPGATKAHIFVPNTKEIEELARKVFDDQIAHRIEERDGGSGGSGGTGGTSTIYYTGSSEALNAGILARDGDFDIDLANRAALAMGALPDDVHLDEIDVMRMLRAGDQYTSHDEQVAQEHPDDRRKKLQDEASTLVRRIQYCTQEPYPYIWSRHGVSKRRPIHQLTDVALEKLIEALNAELYELKSPV